MLSFLFWNLAGQPIQDRVVRLVHAHDVDVIVLAECAVEPDDTLAALNTGRKRRYSFPMSNEEGKLHLFARLPRTAVVERFTSPSGSVSIRRLTIDPRILLAIVHFPSRVNWDESDQTQEATILAADILREEKREGHQRTILVGDLNMNPFHPGIAGSAALHGVMTRDLARREERIVLGRAYRFFYNPMWGFFGDRTTGPPEPITCTRRSR
jgi:hypothetical protein